MLSTLSAALFSAAGETLAAHSPGKDENRSRARHAHEPCWSATGQTDPQHTNLLSAQKGCAERAFLPCYRRHPARPRLMWREKTTAIRTRASCIARDQTMKPQSERAPKRGRNFGCPVFSWIRPFYARKPIDQSVLLPLKILFTQETLSFRFISRFREEIFRR